MKKFIPAIMLLIALALMLTGCGEKETKAEYFATILDSSNDLIIVKYIGPDEKVIIPEEIEGYKVASIAEEAFKDNRNITEVTIPGSIVTIGKYAFSGCTSLKSVKLSDGVESIELRAFENCTALSSVTLPDSLTYIGVSAFYGTSALKQIKFPESKLVMGGSAFAYSGLESVSIPKTLKHSADEDTEDGWWFWRCTGLKKVVYEEGVTDIWLGDYYGTSGSTSNGDEYCFISISDVYIPESAVNFYGSLSNVEFCKVHLASGSAADEYFAGAVSNGRFIRHIKYEDVTYHKFEGEVIYDYK